MKTRVIALFFLVFTLSLCAQAEDDVSIGRNFEQETGCDFRLVNWGDTQEMVILSEEAALAESEEGSLYYIGSAFGHTVAIYYLFEDDKLIQGSFFVYEENPDVSNYIKAFNDIKKQLITRYGEPDIDDVSSSTERYHKPENWPEALDNQDLAVSSYWETPKTLIGLSMTSDGETVYVMVEYAMQ